MADVNQPARQVNSTPLKTKKCLACEYEGMEVICPHCKMLMMDKCDKCQMPKDMCLC